MLIIILLFSRNNQLALALTLSVEIFSDLIGFDDSDNGVAPDEFVATDVVPKEGMVSGISVPVLESPSILLVTLLLNLMHKQQIV